MSGGYIAGGPIDLQITAAEGEGILIALPDRRISTQISTRDEPICQFTLSKDEKFLLLSELQNNIGVHQNLTGHWFLSPVADHVLKNQIARDPVKKELYGMVLDLLAEITKETPAKEQMGWSLLRWLRR